MVDGGGGGGGEGFFGVEGRELKWQSMKSLLNGKLKMIFHTGISGCMYWYHIVTLTLYIVMQHLSNTYSNVPPNHCHPPNKYCTDTCPLSVLLHLQYSVTFLL